MNKSTAQQYTQISEKLAHRFYRECDVTWQDNPLEFVEWIIHLAQNWSSSTWRLRKNALLFYFESKAPSEAILMIKNAQFQKQSITDSELNTSQLKLKRVDKKDFDRLINTLVTSTDKTYDHHIANWLIAGLIVGARPCEWYGSTLVDRAITLRSAKFNDRRACGETRTIHIKETLDPIFYDVIKSHIDTVNAFSTEKLFNDFYRGVRKRLWVINNQLWPNRQKKICLYSTRHQFSANAKRGENNVTVAALMGHRSSATATALYLKSRYGDHSMLFVEPDQRNVALVNDDATTFNDRKTNEIAE